jgi:HNH endonuclease
VAISARDLRLLFQQSGNCCAFPGCTKSLVFPATPRDGAAPSSEVAHIVANSIEGPRGDFPLPAAERDRYENLILLCEEHHHLIDAQPRTHTVERLRQIKYDHESMVAEAVRRAAETRGSEAIRHEQVRERLYSSLLRVERLPKFVYTVKTDFSDREESEVRDYIEPARDGQLYPFIIRGGELICFQDLRNPASAFHKLTGGRKVRWFRSREWWEDPDRFAWYITLLNRTLNKITGHRGLNLDRAHRRYFFMPREPGKPLEISYRPLNKSTARRQVVWQPVTRKTGKPKRFWFHLAVALNFYRVAAEGWCLSIRPEMHLTADGRTRLESASVGRRVTRKKARMFNFDVLKEVQFWRDFLLAGQPRLIASFGQSQALVISSELLSTEIVWPGVPPERAKEFKNVAYEDDLFTLASLYRLDSTDEDEDECQEEGSDDD